MNQPELRKWKTTKSEYVVKDRWLKLRADTCKTLDGHTISPWYVLEYPNWVNCLVVDSEGYVILLNHYRHGIDDYVVEIIGGNIDGTDDPKTTIRRELEEEIGYRGGELYAVGVNYANPSHQTNCNYSFLAVGGTCEAQTTKEVGADFHVMRAPFSEFLKEFTAPAPTQIWQALHLANIYLSLNFIRSAPSPSRAIARLRSQIQSS
jgi:ADP-ribose pyrophosphatase